MTAAREGESGRANINGRSFSANKTGTAKGDDRSDEEDLSTERGGTPAS